MLRSEENKKYFFIKFLLKVEIKKFSFKIIKKFKS